ncbi:MAG TPA: LytTR family transcriptional regulator DNA-binding domain-containing protein [Flavobacterium sp.]
MTNYPYIIIDDTQQGILDTRAVASAFHMLTYAGSAMTMEEGIDLVLERQPKLIFLEINPEDPESGLSLSLISELHRYLTTLPEIVITTRDNSKALHALRYGVFDYMLKPLRMADFRKMILKLDKGNNTAPPIISLPIITAMPEPPVAATVVKESVRPVEMEEPAVMEIPHPVEVPEEQHPAVSVIEQVPEETTEAVPTPLQIPAREEKPLVICVKSYGDYRFIAAADICYLQADNNSTDIHLENGEMVTAFKNLKHFENVLKAPFMRIHNSYIVNADHVSRVHTGNAVCYIKNSTNKLPFSKSYKENVEEMLKNISKGNYLEI